MKRQTAGDLVLLGRDLEQSIQLNGQDIVSLDSEQLVITDAPDEVIYKLKSLFTLKPTLSLKVYIKQMSCL